MDQTLRLQLLRALVSDRQFLHKAAHDVNPDDFPDRQESMIAALALGFWDKYRDTLGPMLSSEASDAAAQAKYGTESREKLKILIRAIEGSVQQVSVQALADRMKLLRAQHFWDTALEEILEAKEKDELTPAKLTELYERAGKELQSIEIRAEDVLSLKNLEKRIARRAETASKKMPKIMIDPLDDRIRMIGRGHFGMLLAPPASGKGHGLAHIAVAYALQGLKVMLISLEDPVDEVEDRFDASLTGISKNRLKGLPNKLRRKFRRARKQMQGRIKLIDGTDGGWSVPQVERAWEQLKRDGFTADAIIIDYDDEIECDRKFTGESARRFEFAHIYRQLRKLAARLQVIVWTAAQTSSAAEGKKIIIGKHAAEDYSKIRKSFLCIGIGQDEEIQNKKHLYVIRHKLDRSKFGVDIMSDFSRAIFYDPEATADMDVEDE